MARCKMAIRALSLVCALLAIGAESAPLDTSDSVFVLPIIHVNDFHARFQETADDGSTCKEGVACVGGFSRLYTTIQRLREEQPDSLLLNAGDNYQGTLYYTFFRWNITQHFMNKLPWDAITLGNHEFDNGVDGVVPFIKSLQAPVVLANLDDSMEPAIQGTYQKSVVVERQGRKIGIIGMIIKTADEISNTENLSFLDESESINAEAERLVREEGVFTNIIVSHTGYMREMGIAAKATAKSKISVIVGGHSHSFLYTGEPSPGPGIPEGPYPTIVNRTEDGKGVVVVQAASLCRYLGNVVVSFDEDGNYVDNIGKPIYLSNDMPKDPEIDEDLEAWTAAFEDIAHQVVGTSLVNLDNANRNVAECPLGNFITDAMVYSYTHKAEPNSWTYASLAVYNSGGLRAPIKNGNITYEDLLTAQPFENTHDVGEIQGKYIWEMFEFSMTPYKFKLLEIDVNMLQLSGFRVVADMNKPVGSRVESVKVRCQACLVPVYEDLDLNKTYRLIVPTFLITGGDGFKVIEDNLKNIQIGTLDSDNFIDYFAHRSPVFQEIEGRFIIKSPEKIKVRRRK